MKSRLPLLIKLRGKGDANAAAAAQADRSKMNEPTTRASVAEASKPRRSFSILNLRTMGLGFALLRTFIAAFVLWVVVADTGARIARQQLAAMDNFDYVKEVRTLREKGRLAEALLVGREGIDHLRGEELAKLTDELRKAEDEQSSVIGKLRRAGVGAITGQGSDLESAVGAIGADLFIVGDVRDLLIQGSKLIVDGEVDPVITALSGLGVVTTIAPEIDVAAAILKIARKTGTLGKSLSQKVVKLARERAIGPLKELASSAATMATKLGPAGTVRLLRLADEPADIAHMARFAERVAGASGDAAHLAGNAGAAKAFSALHITGKDGLELLKNAPKGAEAAHDAALIAAASKGTQGISFIRSGGVQRMLRPHAVIGVVKAFYKGNAEQLVRGILATLDGISWWLIPALGTWLVVELYWLYRRVVPKVVGA